MAKLLAVVRTQSFGPDEVILAQGERRRALFFVRRGAVRVERQHMQFVVEVSRLETGEVFGEMSFVEDFGASASVVADGCVEVDIVDEAVVGQLIRDDTGFEGRFYHSLAEILSRRLRETTIRSMTDYSWGGHDTAEAERREPDDSWGGGSPLRDSTP